MVLVTHALRNEEPTRKIELSENNWFITEVLSVDKDAMFLLPTFKFNDDSVLFLQTLTFLKIIGVTSWVVRDNALQMLLLRASLPVVAGTGFISTDSWQWYWAMLTAFLSNWTILSLSNQSQFLQTVSSEERISYHLRKSSKWLVRSDSLEDMSSTLISSSINSSFERFSSWLLVWTIMIYEYRLYNMKSKVVSATFLLVCFVFLKEKTCETRKNVFYFTLKALFILEMIKF